MSSEWRQGMNAWLSTHHGIVTRAALSELGCDSRQGQRLVSRGELTPVTRGIYRSSHWPVSMDQTMVVLCLRYPAAIIAFTTAARIWGYRKLPNELFIHALIPHAHSPEMEGVVIHRSRRIDAVDVVTRRDGTRVTSPPRTMFDVADMLGPPTATSVLEQALSEGRFTFGTIVDTVARLGHASRPGTRTMRTVLATRPAWRSAVQSDLEARVLAEIVRQRLPAPQTQHPMILDGRTAIRIDFAWPDERVALEVDHPFWHDGTERSTADKQRDRKLNVLGWRTPRLTSFDVDHGLRAAIEDVAAILRVASRSAA
jgi:very-short-patch-repair endonuclease